MPIILEKSLEEFENEKEYQRSIELALGFDGITNIRESSPNFQLIYLNDNKIIVFHRFRALDIRDENEFDVAYRLAERYEQEFKIGYKIKISY